MDLIELALLGLSQFFFGAADRDAKRAQAAGKKPDAKPPELKK